MGVFSRIFEEFTVNKDKRFYDISRPQSQKLDQKLSKAGWLDKKAGVGELFPEKCRKNMENGQYRRICQLPHPVKAPISSSRRLAVKGYKIITPKTSPTKSIKGARKSPKTYIEN